MSLFVQEVSLVGVKINKYIRAPGLITITKKVKNHYGDGSRCPVVRNNIYPPNDIAKLIHCIKKTLLK